MVNTIPPVHGAPRPVDVLECGRGEIISRVGVAGDEHPSTAPFEVGGQRRRRLGYETQTRNGYEFSLRNEKASWPWACENGQYRPRGIHPRRTPCCPLEPILGRLAAP